DTSRYAEIKLFKYNTASILNQFKILAGIADEQLLELDEQDPMVLAYFIPFYKPQQATTEFMQGDQPQVPTLPPPPPPIQQPNQEPEQEPTSLADDATKIGIATTASQLVQEEANQLELLLKTTLEKYEAFKNITVANVRHIFDLTVMRHNGRVYGFHHDYLHNLQQRGAYQFVNKILGPNGEYRADVIVDSIASPKTFFPSTWTHEKVIAKIGEAMGNLYYSKIDECGRSILQGTTSEGIKIKVIIDALTKIVSTYPLMN
ncbi:MAG TPA: EndoU domain-containing protein, partial [Candidatus Babeliales bacterium]|nr:EndoU domain-containing protein [Candidatus Babeliales bacterium]